jgi:DNA-binding NtrC family response regulator
MGVLLIVEDEEQVLVLAKSYLEEHGHTALSADTAEGALAVIEAQDGVDVMFTNVGLQGDLHAGLDLAKQAVERRPSLKVLYTTNQTVTDGMKAMFVEGSALLEKPYTVEQLATSLTVHFGIKPEPAQSQGRGGI